MPTAETTAPTAPQSKPPIDARIVAHGVRPRRYKKPPDLAHEAGAKGDTLPQSESHTLESNGRHYNSRSYAGYPDSEVDEAEQAFGLATILMPMLTNEVFHLRCTPAAKP